MKTSSNYLDQILQQASEQIAAVEKKPIVVTDEIGVMASTITSTYSQHATLVAASWQITKSLLDHYGAANKVSMEPVLDLLGDALLVWMEQMGIRVEDTSNALADLKRAGQTAALLGRLPD